jgi:hypothetical protein
MHGSLQINRQIIKENIEDKRTFLIGGLECPFEYTIEESK